MNEEKIARLEGLLERVRARAAMPRRPAAPAAASFDSTVGVPTGNLGLPSESVAVTAELPTGDLATSSQVLGFDGAGVEAPTGRVSTVPPRVDVPEPEPSSIEVSASELTDVEASDVELEVSSEVVEVDVDVEVEVEVSEPEIPVARKDFESGAQRVVASASFEAEEPATSDIAAAHESFVEPEPLEPLAPANEIGDEPPLSSRRPVAASEPPAEAYPSAPRHTPPPESGKQVAVSSMPVGRVPSVPAPSGEEAFVSGWREPGLASQPPREAAAPLSTRAEARTESAEVIEPVLPADARVARVEGTAAAFAPRSFGELLDATLAL